MSDEGFVRVASIAELPEGELRPFETPDGRVAVAVVGAEVLAVDDTCTHAGCSLAEGTVDDVEGCVICPCHQAAFDLRSGEPVEGPATDPVRVRAVRVRDGWVEVGPAVEP